MWITLHQRSERSCPMTVRRERQKKKKRINEYINKQTVEFNQLILRTSSAHLKQKENVAIEGRVSLLILNGQ